MNDLISIVIPVYNVEQCLNRCVESVNNQNYANMEIILIDDGSTDQSPQICDEWAERDARIKVIHQSNTGVGSTRNNGMAAAHGDFVAFVDSDDCLPNGALQEMVDRMLIDESDLVIGKYADICGTVRQNGYMCRWKGNRIISGLDLLKDADGYNYPFAMWGKLYKRSILQGVACPALVCGEDLWVFPEIIQKCARISLMENTVYNYNNHPNSAMHNRNERSRSDELKATLHMTKHLLDHGFIETAEKWLNRAVMQAIILPNRKRAMSILCETMNKSERRKLTANFSIKRRIQYYSIFVPILFHLVRLVVEWNGKMGAERV